MHTKKLLLLISCLVLAGCASQADREFTDLGEACALQARNVHKPYYEEVSVAQRKLECGPPRTLDYAYSESCKLVDSMKPEDGEKKIQVDINDSKRSNFFHQCIWKTCFVKYGNVTCNASKGATQRRFQLN
jgi:hypothetical protein